MNRNSAIYTIIVDIAVASKRSSVQTLGLIFQKDVDEFGLENMSYPNYDRIERISVRRYL